MGVWVGVRGGGGGGEGGVVSDVSTYATQISVFPSDSPFAPDPREGIEFLRVAEGRDVKCSGGQTVLGGHRANA